MRVLRVAHRGRLVRSVSAMTETCASLRGSSGKSCSVGAHWLERPRSHQNRTDTPGFAINISAARVQLFPLTAAACAAVPSLLSNVATRMRRGGRDGSGLS
jgi:hypothetical protein